jgi:hypothetical protein
LPVLPNLNFMELLVVTLLKGLVLVTVTPTSTALMLPEMIVGS